MLAEEENKAAVLVDGSPGIGCPVVSSLSGASLVVLVTEPTVSGLHDLKRVYELVKKFNIKAGCIVNKADLNQEMLENIKTFLKEEQIELLTEVPYDEKFTAAMTNGKTVVEYDEHLGKIISDSWEKIKKDSRFGRTDYFVIYDEATQEVQSYDNRAIEGEAHGAGPKTAQKLAEVGANVLVTGNGPGGNADAALKTTGILVYVGAKDMSVQKAYELYKAGSLQKA